MSVAFIIILIVIFVGMMLISILPQKKKQREYEAMLDSIKVGTRIITYGRLIGTVVAINTDNTVELDIGTKGNPVVILLRRDGIAMNLDAQALVADANGEGKGNAAEGDVDADDIKEPEVIEAKSEDAADNADNAAEEKGEDDAI